MTSRELRQAGYISHMLEAASLAQSCVGGINKTDFLHDKRTLQAVILNMMVIGEAATKPSDEYPEFVSRFPQAPWESIRGMRHRPAHGYCDINLDVAWKTARQALPKLEGQLRQIQQAL